MTLPLDKHASNVSPGAQEVATTGYRDPQNMGGGFDSASAKKQRHELRLIAGKILPDERVRNCGQKAIGQRVRLHHHDGRANFSGVETCGSVWTCPVCAARITEGRRVEIDAVLEAHRKAGGTVFMATLTIPHYRFQSCKGLREAVSTAFRKVKQGRAWQTARDRFGWIGDIRALEVTHGHNGWHPHLHVLFFFEPGTPRETMDGFGGWFFERWACEVKRTGYGECSQSAFTWELVNTDRGAAEYIGKWGAALELTKAHMKRGKGGRTPWQILADCLQVKSIPDGLLIREYARSFKGARQLTWSRDLRALYSVTDELSDDELAQEPEAPDTHTATLSREAFDAIVSRGLTADVLSAQESAGLDGVCAVLTRNRIPWRISTAPGLERDRTVPLILLGHSSGCPPS